MKPVIHFLQRWWFRIGFPNLFTFKLDNANALINPTKASNCCNA